MGKITEVALALEELARTEERKRCMKAICLYCANGHPAQRVKSTVTGNYFWCHGAPTNSCAAAPIRDMAING